MRADRGDAAAMRNLYTIAHALSMSVSALMELPAEEVAGWTAYFRARNDEGA